MYFSKLIQFQRCRQALQREWDAHASQRLESFPSIDTVELHGGEFNSNVRQQAPDGSVARNLDELFEAAALALPIFASKFIEVTSAASIPSADVKIAPLKSKQRALEKATDDYATRSPGPSTSWLFDVVRGMILCDHEGQVCQLIEAFTSKSLSLDGLEVIRFKNRFKNPTPGGYRDSNMNIILRVNEHCVHICEVQIHLKSVLLVAKAVHSHAVYEFFRTYFRGSAEAVASRLQIMSAALGGLVDEIAIEEVEEDDKTAAGRVKEMIDCAVAKLIEERDSEKFKQFLELLSLMSDFEHMIPLMEQVVSMVIEHNGMISTDTVSAKLSLGIILVDAGRHEEAECVFKSALEHVDIVHGPESLQRAGLLVNLANSHQARQDNVRAREICEEAQAILEKSMVDEPGIDLLTCWNNLAVIMCEGFSDHEKGKELFCKVYQGRQKLLGNNHPHVITSLSNLGAVCGQLLQEEESVRYKMQALRSSERFYGPDHVLTLLMKSNLGNSLDRLGDSSTAERLLLEALEGRTRILGDSNFDTVVTTSNLGEHYLYWNNAALAQKYLLHAQEQCNAMSLSCDTLFYKHLTRLVTDELPVVVQAADWAAKLDSLPMQVNLSDKHAHCLDRCPTVPYPRGIYYCDLCAGKGVGVVYRCGECSFDVHPQCVPCGPKDAIACEPASVAAI